ncbi:MAG TPA: hypothetical protein VF595_04430 [Tepidisphaeraceae bacterium]|jgi:hypothetical protein
MDSQHADDPFARAAAGVRAFGILMLTPLLVYFGSIIIEVTEAVGSQWRQMALDLPVGMFFLLPVAIFWTLSTFVRQGNAIAIAVSLAFIYLLGAIITWAAWVLAQRLLFQNVPHGEPIDIIRKVILADVALIILLIASLFTVIHLHRAENVRRRMLQGRGFAIDMPQPVIPFEEQAESRSA